MAATFRAGVIIVVEHSDGRVLGCERGDITGAWQLPQGGIDEGETPLAAAWRELEEETGTGRGAESFSSARTHFCASRYKVSASLTKSSFISLRP